MEYDNNRYFRVCINDTGVYYNCLCSTYAHLIGMIESNEYTRRNYNIAVVEPIDNNLEYEELTHSLYTIYDIKLGQEPYKFIKQAQNIIKTVAD